MPSGRDFTEVTNALLSETIQDLAYLFEIPQTDLTRPALNFKINKYSEKDPTTGIEYNPDTHVVTIYRPFARLIEDYLKLSENLDKRYKQGEGELNQFKEIEALETAKKYHIKGIMAHDLTHGFRYRKFPERTKDERTDPYRREAEEALSEIVYALFVQNPYLIAERAEQLGASTIEKEAAELGKVGAGLIGDERSKRRAEGYLGIKNGYELGLRASLGLMRLYGKNRIETVRDLLLNQNPRNILDKLEELRKVGDEYRRERGIETEVEGILKQAKRDATSGTANSTKRAVVILFLTLMGTYFLFPQLPNRVTAAFSLLPTTNLLFLNFVVTLLVIVLVYLFTHEKESLNY